MIDPERIDTMYAGVLANQIQFQKYLSANCFGDYDIRSGVAVRTRELLTLTMLLSWGGCESQLKGHTRGNLNLGNDKEPLISVITQLLPYVGCPRTLNAFAVLNEVAQTNLKKCTHP